MALVEPNPELIEYSSKQLVRDIWELLKPYKRKFWLATSIRVLGDLAGLYPTFAFASVVTFLTQYKVGEPLDKLWIILSLWFFLAIVKTAGQSISKLIGFRIAEKIAIDATLKTVQHLFKLDMAWHEAENSGNKIKRLQNAGDGFVTILRIWFISVIEIIVNLVAINIIIAQFDSTILLILVLFLISYFLIGSRMTRKAGEASYRVNIQEEEVIGLEFESINNIRTVKVMAMTEFLFSTLVKSTEELFARIRKRVFWYQSRNGFLNFWALSFKLLIIAVIVWGILNGRYELGFLILFNSYFSDLRTSIDELSTSSVDFAIAKLRIARMKLILSEKIRIDDEHGKFPFAKDWKDISVKNLSFAYGDNEVLKDISFEVKRGEKIGFVGLSGAGKSTLFKLLLKEREEFTGDILFDGLSIKKISKKDYFEQVTVVLQDTEVFNFSLKDNITIANQDNSENFNLLEKALKTAHLSEVVDKLPAGVATLIGEKGVKLSGGERQRLGIARAVFKQPEILLLDEATSHLDIESEDKIQDSLQQFFNNVTAIVIAHRLTTIKQMDKILVLEDGTIVESGSFAELYTKKGRFFELWEKQKL